MPEASDDSGLEVLLALYRKEDTDVSEALLRQCYEMERAFQYDKDRDVPLDKIRRLVESEVNKRFEGQGKKKRGG